MKATWIPDDTISDLSVTTIGTVPPRPLTRSESRSSATPSTRADGREHPSGPRRYRSNGTECESCGDLFRDSRPGQRDPYEPALCSDCRERPTSTAATDQKGQPP